MLKMENNDNTFVLKRKVKEEGKLNKKNKDTKKEGKYYSSSTTPIINQDFLSSSSIITDNEYEVTSEMNKET